VAAFSKRLCRSAIGSPPSTGLFVLALVSNLLRKHSECRFLIQRSDDGEIEDGFVTTTADPTETQALRTSLWEVVALEKHYCSSVAVLAKSLGSRDESKLPLHQTDDFSDHTYESLFEMERKKKRKTALAFVDPQSLLTDKDVFSTFLTTTK
jgi:U3 small nucleolar RNA-associated protein 19